MSEAQVLCKAQSTTSGHTLMTSRQPYISEPIASKRVCFYKSGDAQFSGLPVVINNRTFKTFEALLDSLSKRVPLPFGVRTITTPRGLTAVRSLDQLHHGHSYICSDRRTVKPIDLDRARRKLPPWYHARPVSSRHSAWQAHSHAPRGTRSARRNEHAALLHAPKRLVVFRNGESEVKHTVILQKRTTHSFEVLLNHISELMHFPVLKLHTPDGRRVDGLPALILCSGVLVATGREPFKKRNYDIQKPSPPTWLPAKRVGRLRPKARKKKFSSIKSRLFSPSSESYLVNQIQHSMAGSMCDFPSNPTGSMEIESGQNLESIAETDMITCLDGDGEADIHMPTDDDIEKSFRVNQDGSMTVEMKVRLTIKEQETIHWTTTVSRSSVANKIKAASDSCPNMEAHLPPINDPIPIEVNKCDLIGSNNSCHKEDSKANEHIENNGVAASIEIRSEGGSTHSPGWHKVQQKQSSIENIRAVTETEIQENSSYSYKEELDNGEMMQEYCMVRHSSHPVPKPRVSLPSVLNNNNTTTWLQSSSYRASEVLQIQENGKEVHETVLHIYEKQTCQENLSSNSQLDLQDFSSSPHGSSPSTVTVFPASSDTTVHSLGEDMESETLALASTKCQSIGRQEKPFKPHTFNARKESVTHPPSVTASTKASVSRGISTPGISIKRKPVRVIVKKNHWFKTATPERKHKADILKQIKKIRADILNQTGAMKRKEHYRAIAVQKLLKRRNNGGNGSGSLKPQTEQLDSSVKLIRGDSTLLLAEKETPIQVSAKTNLLYASHSKGKLTRQTSMYKESGSQGETQKISQSMPLPALNSSSSLMNEYVELWLQNSQCEPTPQEPIENTSTFHTGREQEPSTEVTEINCEIVEGVDGATENSIINSNTVQKTSVSTNVSSTNATSQSPLAFEITYPKRQLPKSTSLGKTHMSHEMSPLPKKLTLKKSSHSFNSTFEKSQSATGTSLEKIQSPIDTMQGSPLPSQPSLETIPKNNTMVKASLFNNQTVEKTAPSPKDLIDKKELLRLFNKKSTLLETNQLNSDNSSKKKKIQSSESKTKSSSNDDEISENRSYDIQTKPQTEKIDLQAEKFYTVKMAVRPDMKPVLDQICHSIQSLCEVTRHKRTSCLKKSQSVPDFSLHMASTFGSSSRIILAFLVIMTLKDGLKHLNTYHQAENNLSCSEAMSILQSLKELGGVEDAEQLRASLKDLYTSASVQFLDSWKVFQEMSNKRLIVQPYSTGNESLLRSSSEDEEQAIQGLMGDLGVPERVREVLAAFSSVDVICNQDENTEVRDSLPEVNVNQFSELHPREDMVSSLDFVLEDYANLYVHSVIDRAVNSHIKESSASQKDIVVMADIHQKDLRDENIFSVKRTENCNSIPHSDICEDMPSSESSFGAELVFKRREDLIDEVRHKEETVEKHQEMEEEMREDRQRIIDEGRGTFEENSSEVENPESLEEVMRKVVNDKVVDRDRSEEVPLVCCEGKLTSLEEEKFNQEREDGRCDEGLEERSFNEEENLAVESPLANDGVNQIHSNEEILGDCQAFPTQDQFDDSAFEEQCIPRVIHIEPNLGMHKVQHSKTHQDFCMESMTYSEAERVIIEPPECYTIYQENFEELPEEVNEEYEENETDFKEERANSLVQLISYLQDQERTVDRKPYNPAQMAGERVLNHMNAKNLEAPNIIKPTENASIDAVPSSLAFSYVSKNSTLAKEPEANIQINTVKSIREMFLAKSNADMQHGQTQLTSPSFDLSDYQPEYSNSRERQSSTSPEVSREDKDTCRLAIAKGYVKRTIERLYGKGSKGSVSDEKSTPSTQKARKNEGLRGPHVTSLASIHESRTNVISDLSYFNATSSIDGFNEPTHFVTLNVQVGPKDAVLIDKGRWLLRETSPKLSPEPEDTPTNVKKKVALDEPKQDSGKEDIPYSLFGPTTPDKALGEQGELAETQGTNFSYFHLPNANDSELEPDEQKTNINTPKRKTENKVTALTEPPKGWAEKHSIRTVFSPPDIKKAANKVHPVIETTPPVVTQPTKVQSAQTEVIRCSAEPDVLERLYMFCGQHCPIL